MDRKLSYEEYVNNTPSLMLDEATNWRQESINESKQTEKNELNTGAILRALSAVCELAGASSEHEPVSAVPTVESSEQNTASNDKEDSSDAKATDVSIPENDVIVDIHEPIVSNGITATTKKSIKILENIFSDYAHDYDADEIRYIRSIKRTMSNMKNYNDFIDFCMDWSSKNYFTAKDFIVLHIIYTTEKPELYLPYLSFNLFNTRSAYEEPFHYTLERMRKGLKEKYDIR